MLEGLRRKHPGSSVAKIISWRLFQFASEVFLTVFYRLEVRNQQVVPPVGPVLIAANHQSYLDPTAVGCRIRNRQIDFVARLGLFSNKHLGRFFAFLNSIPVAEEGPDTAAIKEIIRRLRMGRCVMIFPEGSRTETGAVQPFKRGVAVLVKRAKCPVIPAAIDGAYQAWPRHRARPLLWRAPKIRVRFGEPIPYDELMADGPDAALARVEREVRALHQQLNPAAAPPTPTTTTPTTTTPEHADTDTAETAT
ncbi:MAG: lysophospholipid acyltransferase family protein [Planctomycetota bacterium]|nr:lysophospholipid acyltransferase family protein [Planctomycetota bacterium]